MNVAVVDKRRAALVCHRGPSAAHKAEWTYWCSTGQARQAETELTPCGPLCIGVHSVVRLDHAMPSPRRRGPAYQLAGSAR